MKLEQLPVLLRLLADPTTPHTAVELWCRIEAWGWNESVPILMRELETGEPCVKRLVLSIIWQELEQLGPDRVQPFVPCILPLLDDPDRLVRMAAVQAVRDLHLNEAIPQLRRIVCDDERPLAAEALVALMDLDEELLDDLIKSVREKLDGKE
ncbi:HEAT repeat domain-containing protein [Rubinisphaera brasiliensis]|uniref:HEAT domain containing protein n=1 Tax=Rubinisphaera brasiliensis (strain ATCC 49424 / DSM 5305 / JCM 21570 / IAM 15109 / NBRC 103401 / IFAM 1448) TaxID=756272 RepID=F0SLP3_RUBBR|nr:HEAT repeat domain-containing protein [Rubinisphaera brasiliensis]ADY58784.1 HEAT domain containing protein [Rubinisphaera brasiliensis DSM 5305]